MFVEMQMYLPMSQADFMGVQDGLIDIQLDSGDQLRKGPQSTAIFFPPHAQCSLQFVPSIIPITRLSHPPSPEGIMLSEISQAKKDSYMVSLICGT